MPGLLTIAKTAIKVGGAISRSKVWKGAMKGVVGAVGLTSKAAKPAASLAVAGAAWSAGSAIGGRMFGAPAGSGGLPALNLKGLPSVPGSTGQISQLEQQFPDTLALNHPYIRTYYRAPHGYVIVHDPVTRQPVMAVRKSIAKANHLWKPKPKPPISVRDWHCYKRAKVVEKRLAKIAKHSIHKHHSRQIVYRGAARRSGGARQEIINVK